MWRRHGRDRADRFGHAGSVLLPGRSRVMRGWCLQLLQLQVLAIAIHLGRPQFGSAQNEVPVTPPPPPPAPCEDMPILHSNRASGNPCAGVAGNACSYQCDVGFRAQGSAGRATCGTSGGSFSTPTITCSPNACSGFAVDHSDRGSSNPCTGMTDETCSFQCDIGYTNLAAAGQTTCGSDGRFGTPTATCTANPCNDVAIDHSYRDSSNPCAGVYGGDTCSYTCRRGYTSH